MTDSAGRFTDPLVSRPSAAQRPVNDLSGNGFQTGAVDAQRQAAAGEARVIGVDQDASASGRDDAASGQARLRAGMANTPAPGPQFTRDRQ